MKDLELMDKNELKVMQEKIAILLNKKGSDKISNLIECVKREEEMRIRHRQEEELLEEEMEYLPLLKELKYITCAHYDGIFIYGDRDENQNFKGVKLMLDTKTLVAKERELPALEKVNKIEEFFGQKITILKG